MAIHAWSMDACIRCVDSSSLIWFVCRINSLAIYLNSESDPKGSSSRLRSSSSRKSGAFMHMSTLESSPAAAAAAAAAAEDRGASVVGAARAACRLGGKVMGGADVGGPLLSNSDTDSTSGAPDEEEEGAAMGARTSAPEEEEEEEEDAPSIAPLPPAAPLGLPLRSVGSGWRGALGTAPFPVCVWFAFARLMAPASAACAAVGATLGRPKLSKWCSITSPTSLWGGVGD